MLSVHVSPNILNQLMDFHKIGYKHYALEGIGRACGANGVEKCIWGFCGET
jgi:hypothetical protein